MVGKHEGITCYQFEARIGIGGGRTRVGGFPGSGVDEGFPGSGVDEGERLEARQELEPAER
mgnify:CR=1 FL=1